MRGFFSGPFTGRHFTAIMVAFFGVVIAVNMLMARLASSTFGGVVVENSYVASQNFNKWLGEAEKQKALGWKAVARRQADGRIAVTLTGAPSAGVALSAEARHPLGHLPNQSLRFRNDGGVFVSEAPLATGRWRLRIDAVAGQQHWREEMDVL